LNDTFQGAIDCDIHPHTPTPRELSRYMDEHWRDTVEVRGIDSYEAISYPPGAPLTKRGDWRNSGADGSAELLAAAMLDRLQFARAICNCHRPMPTAPRAGKCRRASRSSTVMCIPRFVR
jgi:hypothetical protein